MQPTGENEELHIIHVRNCIYAFVICYSFRPHSHGIVLYNFQTAMYDIVYIIGASVSEAPSCGLDGRAVMHDIYIRPAPATAHARRYAQT